MKHIDTVGLYLSDTNRSILKYAGNIFSQFGEDLIIEECIKRIKPIKVCCEFGANNAVFCSNTYHLLKQGWYGVMIEADESVRESAMINLYGCHCDYTTSLVTPENVNILLPRRIGVLSMDTDGPDAGIWSAYTGEADIVVIEINSSLDPELDFYHPSKGANYSYMKRLGESKGYFLLAHTGNMIFTLNKYKELFPDLDITFNKSWL